MMHAPLNDVAKSTYEDLEQAARSPWLGLLDTMPTWFWSCDASYELTYVSQSVTRITGTTPHMLKGVCILSEGHGSPQDNPGLSDYHKVLRARKPFDRFSYERLLKSGERAVLMDSGVPQFDVHGAFTGYLGISLHLSHAVNAAGETASLISTLKLRAEELEQELQRRNTQLEASNKLLKEVVEAMGQGLVVSTGTKLNDPDNKVVMVNPAYRELFNLSETDIIPGKTMRDAVTVVMERSGIPFSEGALEQVENGLKRGDPWLIDIKNLKRSTSVKTALRPSGGYVIVHTDVTDLRDRNVMLEQARDAAQVANQAKSNFLATMSHEIRTPMNGVVGMADLLADTALDKDQLSYVETIRTSALALTGLISDILDFSKIEAGRVTVQNVPFDLHKVMKDVCVLVDPLAQIKSLNFDMNIGSNVPRAVMGDPLRLRQVLLNLLGNAVKFTQKGGVKLLVTSEPGQPHISFEVRDTGIGIPKDKIEQVFTPFEQIDSGLQRQFEGTGLGLSITRTLAQAMKGEVSVTSKAGHGSSFRLCLPFSPSDMVLPDITAKPADAMDCTGVHILVAEDNRTNQLVVQRMLERTGANITTVKNGKEAYDAFVNTRFDLILMDISMPVMTGLEACRAIRKHESDHDIASCPIIALTGNAFEKDQDACVLAGMNGFLTKPVRLADITQCLRSHLGDEFVTAQTG